MAHNEKLPGPSLLNRTHNKIQVNGNGHNKELLISFNSLSNTGWYVNGSDVIYSTNGSDRVIYGLEHAAFMRPILINDYEYPPDIQGGGLLFKKSNDSALWWRTPENGDQQLNINRDGLIYKKFNTQGLFYTIDNVEYAICYDDIKSIMIPDVDQTQALDALASLDNLNDEITPTVIPTRKTSLIYHPPLETSREIATLDIDGISHSLTQSQTQPQTIITFPLNDTQQRHADAPSFSINGSGMFLDTNGNLSFSVNKILNTTMQPDGTIITDGYLFMDGHAIRSTPTDLIFTIGTHTIKFTDGMVRAIAVKTDALRSNVVKSDVLSADILTSLNNNRILSVNALNMTTMHNKVTFDDIPFVKNIPISTYSPSLNMAACNLTPGDIVYINAQGIACKYLGGKVLNIDNFISADNIVFKSDVEMISSLNTTLTLPTAQQISPGYIISSLYYAIVSDILSIYHIDGQKIGEVPTRSIEASTVDHDHILLINNGILYVLNITTANCINVKIPLETSGPWLISVLPGYTGVITSSYFKIVFLYSSLVITWGQPYADYQCAGCLAITYNCKYNVLVSLEKTFLSDSYLQVLDITGLMLNKLFTRAAFPGAFDMAYNEQTESYLIAVSDSMLTFKPFYYDGRDLTFGLSYSDREFKKAISKLTPCDDHFILAYMSDSLLISTFYDQRADIVGMALTTTDAGHSDIQIIGSVVQLPSELPNKYVGKKLYLYSTRPYPDNLRPGSGIYIGVCLDKLHLKI